uniref:NADH-ubiquinone oxidoreductase chain 2 n=1 Tax=Drabescoides nuchalis TaxID=1725375 RepID=A0A0U2KFF3_9HEMI|nr:NADH dehydrogenase subunit 2 [Drabescoides nuchalis]ALF99730.1 NADH dehydrogenase subunit 2 [Drabescoides nuchalis]
MSFNSTKTLLTNTMMIGVIMTICSNNWFSMWMGLEITLMSFIPMLQNNNILSSESMIKYFIVQSVASTLMLLSIFIMLIGVSMMNQYLLMTAMLIKVGSAPFHNWVIMIIETINYYEMWIMLTIIKMPPLTILYQTNVNKLTFPIILGLILSSISCLNQTSMRKTIGFSSIYNMSMMILIVNKFNLLIIFMTIYSVMMGILVNFINKLKIKFVNQMIFNEKNVKLKLNLWINMLSMGGFPPLMGFFMKLLVIQMLLQENITMTMVIMLTSMFVMMFYMRLAFTSMITIHSSMKWSKNKYNNYFTMIINIILFPILISLTEAL